MKFFVHPSSQIDNGAFIGEGTKIWHFCHVMRQACIGKNCVLNSTHDIRPYDIYGSYLLTGGFGFKTYIKHYWALLIDVYFEIKNYTFENYGYNDRLMYFLKLSLTL